MGRIIIVSNRLPLQIKIKENNLDIQPSIGGLATGMKSVHKNKESKWIGWTGLADEELTPKLSKDVNKAVEKEDCVPVELTKTEVDKFYYGFSNKTLWPLFHYFTEFTEYDNQNWEAYKKVNRKYADVILKTLKKGDKLWIHDYHLLLLPKMIKDERPDISIGFFLHIPFPSFEVFRILPWRKEILNGMIGSDLIGFHTYDYERHFISSVRRILGHDISFNTVIINGKLSKVESFPMGIDFDKFYNAAVELHQKSISDKTRIQQELDRYRLMAPDAKLILSIDRLDYTKGIAERLFAFEYFLENYPEFRQRATLIMLAVPSRSNVRQYQLMKKEVDELVGRINGRFGTVNWVPVWYFYRSMPFENLVGLYTSCEVALLTPKRDGMNLVAKEYVACRVDKKGVLVLSEMTGASKEMTESIIINPNNFDEVAAALQKALTMPEKEQMERITVLQERLKRYNIDKWATEFLNSLNGMEELIADYIPDTLTDSLKKDIVKQYKKAKKRIFFLDYDGTLVDFAEDPKDAKPDNQLFKILDELSADQSTKVVLISDRDQKTNEKWFGKKNYTVIIEHGIWVKNPDNDWFEAEQMPTDWKKAVRPLLQFYVDRTPGTFLEEKDYSLVWHYRKTDPELGESRANELKDEMTSLIANHDLEILEGNKVVEIKNGGINKGRSALKILAEEDYDFIFCAGDDWSDENLFDHLPERTISIKVGLQNSRAKYNVKKPAELRRLLDQFVGRE